MRGFEQSYSYHIKQVQKNQEKRKVLLCWKRLFWWVWYPGIVGLVDTWNIIHSHFCLFSYPSHSSICILFCLSILPDWFQENPSYKKNYLSTLSALHNTRVNFPCIYCLYLSENPVRAFVGEFSLESKSFF